MSISESSRESESQKAHGVKLPFVSVIMPVRNEADFIARSLDAVLTQDYPQFEVIIVDGMSTDGTKEIAAQAAAQCPQIPVKILGNPGLIVPKGLNIGLSHAKGDVIIRVDGHALVERDYMRQCVDALARSGADNVGGRMDAVGEGFVGTAIAVATSSPFGVGGARFHYSEREEWVDTVYLGAWPRAIFERIGTFDEELMRNQDDEFNYRLLAYNGRILLSDRIKVRYYTRRTLGSLWRQYMQYGFWKVRVMQKHPRQMRLRHFLPPLLVAGIVGGAILAVFNPVLRWLWLAGLALYVVANLVASTWTAYRHGWRNLQLLPFVYATLHIGYGSGFLLGLVKFAGRWRDK